MSSQVEVRSVADLKSLKSAIVRFRSDANAELDRAENGIRETVAWLDERRTYWRREIKRWTRAVERARADLEDCESESDDDDDGGSGRDCSEYSKAVARGQRRLDEAEHELRVVEQATRAVAEAAKEYQSQATRLRNQLSKDLPNASSYLDRQVRQLEQYAQMATPGVAAKFGASGASGESSSGATISDGGSWRDAGIQMVPLNLINDGDTSVGGDWDAHKGVTMSEMDEGLRKLHEVILPGLEGGHGSDYFQGLDASEGLSGGNSYSNLYDVYFGDSAVTLNRVGEAYEVEDGFHRIYRSRSLGYESIPARVFVPGND